MNLRLRLQELDKLLQVVERGNKELAREYSIKARRYMMDAFPMDYRERLCESSEEFATVFLWMRRFHFVCSCSPKSEFGNKYREELGKDWRIELIKNRSKHLRDAIGHVLKLYF